MKHLKTFESYKTNEEVSFKGLISIISSLMLTFQSIEANAFPHGGGQGGRRFAQASTNEIHSQLSKVKKDLENIKLQANDPALESLISSIQSLESWEYSDGMSKVLPIIQQLKSYISSQNINDPEINNAINNLSDGKLEMLQSDYTNLLDKYEEIKRETELGRDITIVVCLLIAIMAFIVAKPLIYKARHGGI